MLFLPSPLVGEGGEIAVRPGARIVRFTPKDPIIPLSDTLKSLIRSAWDDGYPLLVASMGREGPNITPKGSMIVFDDAHLAWWERSKRAVLDNLGHDSRVCIIYANFKAQRDGVLEFGLPALFRSRRIARVGAYARGDLRQAVAARADPHRRRSRHRRAGQDRQGDRRARQAVHVRRPAAPAKPPHPPALRDPTSPRPRGEVKRGGGGFIPAPARNMTGPRWRRAC